MATRLPLFPLDAALFPGARLGLHIFEPRYRALLADITATDLRFGMVSANPDGGPPAPGSVGCVARVIHQQLLANGESTVQVIGEERFILRSLDADEAPYLVGEVDQFDDEADPPPLPGDLLITLRALGLRCRAAAELLFETPPEESWSEDPARLTFQIAAIMPWQTDEARHLLTLKSAAERGVLLLQFLPRLVPELEARVAIHNRARTNGHGPSAHPA